MQLKGFENKINQEQTPRDSSLTPDFNDNEKFNNYYKPWKDGFGIFAQRVSNVANSDVADQIPTNDSLDSQQSFYYATM